MVVEVPSFVVASIYPKVFLDSGFECIPLVSIASFYRHNGKKSFKPTKDF